MKISEQIAVAIFNPKSLSEKSKSIVQLRSEVEDYCRIRIVDELKKVTKSIYLNNGIGTTVARRIQELEGGDFNFFEHTKKLIKELKQK